MTRFQRIAVARSFGGPEVIGIEDQPIRELPPGAVLVAVRAAGFNPVDARRRAGTFGGQPPLVFGTEFAGVVVESKNPDWQPGQAVIGWGTLGAHADLVVADGAALIEKPENLDWALAGGFGGVSRTAMTAIDALRLAEGDTVVLHGAAGGVGMVLSQLLVARGITVIGTASEANHDRLRELGVIPVAYGPGTAQRVTEAAAGAPLVASIDMAGSAEAGDIATAVRTAGGEAITLVPETAGSHGIPLVRVQASLPQMRRLVDDLTAGRLQLPVETVPLTGIADAHARLDSKRAHSKLVLDLSDNPFLPDNHEGA